MSGSGNDFVDGRRPDASRPALSSEPASHSAHLRPRNRRRSRRHRVPRAVDARDRPAHATSTPTARAPTSAATRRCARRGWRSSWGSADRRGFRSRPTRGVVRRGSRDGQPGDRPAAGRRTSGRASMESRSSDRRAPDRLRAGRRSAPGHPVRRRRRPSTSSGRGRPLRLASGALPQGANVNFVSPASDRPAGRCGPTSAASRPRPWRAAAGRWRRRFCWRPGSEADPSRVELETSSGRTLSGLPLCDPAASGIRRLAAKAAWSSRRVFRRSGPQSCRHAEPLGRAVERVENGVLHSFSPVCSLHNTSYTYITGGPVGPVARLLHMVTSVLRSRPIRLG